MTGSYKRIAKGAYSGVVKDVGFILWTCPHIHRSPRTAEDCAWADVRRNRREVEAIDKAYFAALYGSQS